MPRDTVPQFAARIKAKYPDYATVDDQELVTRWLEKFPTYRDMVTHDPTMGDSLATGAMRIGGGILGGVLGAAGGPVGIAAGGAAGAAGGEALAELYEKVRGLRQDINPAQIAVQGALGAIPVPGVAKGAGVLKSALVHGAQGAGMGAVATAATELADTGQLPSLGQVAQGAGMGAVAGGTIGGLSAKVQQPAGIPSRLLRLEEMRQERLATGKAPSLADKAADLPKNLQRRYVDQFVDVRDLEKWIEADAAQRGVPMSIPEAAKASNIIDVEYGGVGGRIENAKKGFQTVTDSATASQIYQPVNDYVQLMAFAHADRALRDKAMALMRNPATRQEGQDLLLKVQGGAALPKNYTSIEIAQDLQQLQAQNPQHWADIERYGKEIFSRQRKTLDDLLAEGIISQDAWQTFTNRGNDYAPLPRLMGGDDQNPNRFGALDLKSQQVIFERRGSERTTVDPLKAAFEREQEAIKEIARNKMGRAVANLASFGRGNTIIKELQPGHAPQKGYGKIGFYDNGQKREFEVPEAIANAINMANKPGNMPGEAVLRSTRRIAQGMMTAWNLGFSVTNVLRDIQDARKLSPYNKEFQFHNPRTWISGPKDFAAFAKEWGQNWRKVIAEDADYLAFRESGASYSTLQKNISPESFLAPPPEGILAKAIHKVERFSNANEEATKLTAFRRAKAAGKTDFEAALDTRRTGGSPDFARRGTHGVIANQLFMFFNAQVQGAARNIRHFKEDPRRLMDTFASASIAAYALDSYNRSFTDPDGTLALDRVSDQDKQTNWIIVLPDTYTTSNGTERHKYIKVPKGHINRLVYGPIEESLEWLRHPEKSSVLQVMADGVGNVIPGSFNLKADDPIGSLRRGAISSLNPALKIPAEWNLNEDTYRNIPIEAKRLEGVDVTERKTATTSPTLATVSKMLHQMGIAEPLGASPQKLQHALASITPGPGEMVLGAADLLQGKPSAVPLEGDEAMSRMPVAGPILRRIFGSPLDQQDADRLRRFYDLLAESDKASKTSKTLQTRSPHEAMAFTSDKEKQQLVAWNPHLVRFAKELADIRRMREIMAFNPPPGHAAKLRQLGQRESAMIAQIDAMIAQLSPAE
jgi:hypothetical protein